MHELAVTQDILRIAVEEGLANRASKVTDIFMTIGQLSSIVDDSIQYYWDQISQGTICEGAKLHFSRPVAKLACQKCGCEFEMGDELIPCPQCNSFDLGVVSGDEMLVDQIEILNEGENA